MAGHCAIRDWDLIYVIGTSEDHDLEVLVLNITSHHWQTLDPDLDRPKARRDFACSLSDDKERILISGGKLNDTLAVDEFFSFDIRSHRWNQLPSSLQPRSGHVMTNYRNRTTIVGGIDANDNSLVSMESYDNLNHWSELEDKLTKSRGNFRATQVPSSFFPQT